MTNPSHKWPSARTWTREQIRAARITPLVPLLQKRGLQLVAREAGNFILPAEHVLTWRAFVPKF